MPRIIYLSHINIDMRVSIITINYNNLDGLRKTVESVVGQTYHDFEYIIVDGASTDGGAEYLKDVGSMSYPFVLKWVSEKDSGIYNAMNKGVRMAEGEYVLMLNSGDYLVDEHVIERIIPELEGTDIVQGNNIELRGNKRSRYKGYAHSDIDFFDVMRGRFLHQASFCRRDLFERYGYFDESYRISGDTKFFLNCLGAHNATFKYVDIDVVNYDCTGISASQSGEWYEQGVKENTRLRDELFSKRIQKHFEDNDKKIQLYDVLHKHKWIWYLTMAVAHIYRLFYGDYPEDFKREEIE